MLKTKMVVGLLLSLTIATGAEAQGGLIKKKLGDALKKKADPTQKADTPEEGPKFAFALTEGTMAAFKRGVELEVRMRDEYRSRLANLKTPEQYKACETQTALSSDGMKVMEEYSTRASNVKAPEDMTKVTEWMGQTMKALVQKRCGEDPGPVMRQQREAFEKAEAAGATEFAKGWSQPSSPEEPAGAADLSATTGDFVDARLDSDAAPSDDFTSVSFTPRAGCGGSYSARYATSHSRPDQDDDKLSWYRKTKELLEKYCTLTPEQRAEAQKNGIQIPGQGTNIYWVFTRAFAIWVGDDCDHLLKLFAHLQ